MIPKNPGAYPDPVDYRDYDYERIAEVFGAPAIDWDKGYEVPENTGIKVEDQNGSSSCVGQAWSTYSEILEKIENKLFTDLSAKYIYSQIFLPQGGAYIREGAKILTNQGVSPELLLPSYPATEDHMRRVGDITEDIRLKAVPYKVKSYASIWHKGQIDLLAQAIQQNSGVVTGVYGHNSGWGTAWVTPPTVNDVWGHAFYCVGYFRKDGRKYIKFLNSWGKDWGDNGYGYLGEGYFTTANIFSAWTLVDLPNINKDMVQLISKTGDTKVWAISNGKRYWVLDPETLNKGGSIWGAWADVKEDDPLKYEYGGAIFIAGTDDPLK